nr:leucine-rich repeat domain-containing protein [Haliscomenobacter sp.]
MTSLYFSSNQISDLKPISKLCNLTSLYCNGQISELEPIESSIIFQFCKNQITT